MICHQVSTHISYMDDIVTGALGSVLSKLAEFLKDEYNLQAGVREKITSLSRELESMHAALRKVAEVPPKELDELVKLWARDVRELSYTVEDILDDFLVRVEAGRKRKDPDMKWYQHAANKILEVFSQAKARREISCMIRKINEKAKEVAMRRERYRVDSIVAKPAAKNTVDPRLKLMYREVTQLVGMDKSRGELMSMLQVDDASSENIVRIVSVFGAGGLGKTTLAKTSYDELKSSYDCSAFVLVGQNPDFLKVFKDILFSLDKIKYENIHNTGRGVDLLISELQEFVKNKRYFIVIDDIWEPQSWESIKLALDGNNCGSRIIITTRKLEVVKEAGEVYKLQPLSSHNSKSLFYMRLFGGEDKCPNNHPDELSDGILKKCGGVPLAIITMANLLLGKPREEWIAVRRSPGFCQDKDDRHMENTMHILSLSYYDLPSHLKTCLLYLSVFPEDSLIDKDSLIWKWIAEGFVEKKPRRGLFEVGEEYFHDLINRSMIQGVDSEDYGIMIGCRVHDMVLDLIVSISREENFVSVDGTLAQCHTRRLAPQNRELDLSQETHVNLAQVRSVVAWRCAIVKWALHPRLKLISVLSLEYCTFREGCQSLGHIGNLLHLRYLGIRHNKLVEKLLEGIGRLKFLQTLELEDLFGVRIRELPCSIGMLTQLVCLRAQHNITAPDGVIGRLTSLEELQIGGPRDNDQSRRQFVKDLGNLCELRVLKIKGGPNWFGMDDSMQIDLLQSLGNLQKMQHLALPCFIYNVNMNAWDAAVPSRDLRCLFLSGVFFTKLPSWINYARLPSLSRLGIRVHALDEQGLKAPGGGLPELCYLCLDTRSTAIVTSSNTKADGCFQKLRSLVLPDSMVLFVANEDSSASFAVWYADGRGPIGWRRKKDHCRVVPGVVMPNLEELEFVVWVDQLLQNNISYEDIGLEYLPSIRRVKVELLCEDASEDEVEREEAALRHAIEVHPNRPALQIKYRGKHFFKSCCFNQKRKKAPLRTIGG